MSTSTMSAAIERHRAKLIDLGKEIWAHPEISGKEHFAHLTITEYLEKQGFDVKRDYLVQNGFKAEFSVDKSTDDDGTPCVAFLCEYDALPELGHGAGKNLTVVIACGAALVCKQQLTETKAKGRIVVMGCPMEECGSGKIIMLREGGFDGVTAVMLANPMNNNMAHSPTKAQLFTRAEYTGRWSHAAYRPWEGRNAQDAAVACYTNISLLRQHIKPTWSVSGLITGTGTTLANMVPKKASLEYWLRAEDVPNLFLLKQRITNCFLAAAKATDCEVNFDVDDKQVEPVNENEALTRLYVETAKRSGLPMDDEPPCYLGTSDVGNVSHVVPCLFPSVDIGVSVHKNTEEFRDGSNTEVAYANAIRMGQIFANVALEVLKRPQSLQE